LQKLQKFGNIESSQSSSIEAFGSYSKVLAQNVTQPEKKGSQQDTKRLSRPILI
jgi:hypothetical protein